MAIRSTSIYVAAGILVAFSGFAQNSTPGATTPGAVTRASSTPSTAATSTNTTASSNANASSKGTKGTDTKFAQEAAVGGLAEVEMGKIAVQKGQSDQVKQFGQRMIDDHSKASDELKAIAAKQNIMLPTEIDAKHKSTVNKLSGLSGTAFDRAYMSEMVKDHQHDVSDFQKEASGGSNSDLKDWAAKTLPTLQDHLRMAQEASKSVGAMTSK